MHHHIPAAFAPSKIATTASRLSLSAWFGAWVDGGAVGATHPGRTRRRRTEQLGPKLSVSVELWECECTRSQSKWPNVVRALRACTAGTRWPHAWVDLWGLWGVCMHLRNKSAL
eukprot:359459-Chlamydomonas_euryale.AAC.10